MVDLDTTRRDAPWAWLKQGFSDMMSAPVISIGYGLVFTLVGIAITIGLWSIGQATLTPVLAGGFALIAPAFAVGIYRVSQVRESTASLLKLTKESSFSTFLVGHVTKKGTIAGPRVLEHMVDTVLYFEGDRHHAYRILRSVKNRFGAANEIGVFEMRETGLREVENPSEIFLSERSYGVSGSTVVCSPEGTRPILVEIQALVAPSQLSQPQGLTPPAQFRRVPVSTRFEVRRRSERGSSTNRVTAPKALGS